MKNHDKEIARLRQLVERYANSPGKLARSKAVLNRLLGRTPTTTTKTPSVRRPKGPTGAERRRQARLAARDVLVKEHRAIELAAAWGDTPAAVKRQERLAGALAVEAGRLAGRRETKARKGKRRAGVTFGAGAGRKAAVADLKQALQPPRQTVSAPGTVQVFADHDVRLAAERSAARIPRLQPTPQWAKPTGSNLIAPFAELDGPTMAATLKKLRSVLTARDGEEAAAMRIGQTVRGWLPETKRYEQGTVLKKRGSTVEVLFRTETGSNDPAKAMQDIIRTYPPHRLTFGRQARTAGSAAQRRAVDHKRLALLARSAHKPAAFIGWEPGKRPLATAWTPAPAGPPSEALKAKWAKEATQSTRQRAEGMGR